VSQHFERWVENLYLGINDADDDDGDDDVGTTAISKVRKTIEVQIDWGVSERIPLRGAIAEDGRIVGRTAKTVKWGQGTFGYWRTCM